MRRWMRRYRRQVCRAGIRGPFWRGGPRVQEERLALPTTAAHTKSVVMASSPVADAKALEQAATALDVVELPYEGEYHVGCCSRPWFWVTAIGTQDMHACMHPRLC
jgi:hypothetical protein